MSNAALFGELARVVHVDGLLVLHDQTRLWPLGVSRCPGAAGRLRVLRGGALGSNGKPRVVPGLHASGEDGDRRKVVIP